MSYFVGIDIGASFIKGAILDLRKLTISHITKYLSPAIIATKQKRKSPYLRFEIEASKYVKLTQKVLQELLTKARGKVDGIVFSSQMHGAVLVDRNHNAVTPFIGWQDERVLEQSNKKALSWMELFGERLKGIDTSNTGITLRAGLSGLTLFWLQQNGVLKKYPNAQLLSIGDYIATTLTGGKRLMHPTHACGTALFDVKHNRWDEAVLKALHISKRHLPETAETGRVVGHYHYKTQRIPVYACVGDLQAAAAGSLLVKDQLSINIGTGSQVSFIGDRFKAGNYDIRSYFDHKFLYTVTHNPAGRALNVIVNFLVEVGKEIYGASEEPEKVWEKLNKLVKNQKDSQGVKARISFFRNNVTVFTNGYWQGVTETNWTVGNMFFAALENMVENYWDAYQRLGKKRFKEIVLAGGLVRKSKSLQKLIRQRFAPKTTLAKCEEETLAGLLVYALVCCKRFYSIQSASSHCRRVKILARQR